MGKGFILDISPLNLPLCQSTCTRIRTRSIFNLFFYGKIKQSYLGPSVDHARDNVRLLLSSMEEVVPTILSQDQLVQGVSTDVGMPLREVVLDTSGVSH